MRVMQGGHDVPDEKLEARFQRTLANLERAIKALPVVIILRQHRPRPPFPARSGLRERQADRAIEPTSCIGRTRGGV
jgi:hypothetical protein